MRVAVIGAGPAGITVAYQLSKHIPSGKVRQLDVYEISSAPGGLAKSLTLWNQTVDQGPHRFFSHDRRVNLLWLEVAGKEYRMVNRQTRIYYKGKFFDYPLKPVNALVNLGFFEAARCMLSYFREKIIPTRDTGTFESWVTRRFGKRLFEIFFKTYSEKLWGIRCTELDSDFAAQRIKRLSLYEAVKNALMKNPRQVHKTLVDQFAYPVTGSGSIYRKMADKVINNGGTMHYETSVKRVITTSGQAEAIELEDGTIHTYDRIISTMPLSLLVTRLPNVSEHIISLANKLKFRNTILVYLKVESPSLFPDQWLYIHSQDLKMGRMTNFHNWIPELYKQEQASILCLEYWCYFEDPAWSESDEYFINLAKNEARSTGLTRDAEISAGHIVRIPRCYPVYFSNYKQVIRPLQDYLNNIRNLYVIGRYGAYKYNNQDHSIIMGILAAENILEGKDHDLWAINTDYDTYQESSVISETGLVDM